MPETTLVPPAALMPIPRAVAWSGFSRSGIYRAHAEGRLLLRKAGRTTLVDGASLAALVASLPAAPLRAAPLRQPARAEAA